MVFCVEVCCLCDALCVGYDMGLTVSIPVCTHLTHSCVTVQ